jgi:hypothetical protein
MTKFSHTESQSKPGMSSTEVTKNEPNSVRFWLAPPGTRVTIILVSVALILIFVAVISAAWTSNPGDLLKGLAELVKAVAWPAGLVLLFMAFREAIIGQFGRVKTLELAGGRVEFAAAIEMRLQESAAEAQAKPVGKDQGVSSGEIDRAQVINRLATSSDLASIRQRMLGLATEYRFVRGSMPSGPERTRAMTVVMSKMRTLGQAAFALRGEFAFSSDPGQRLAALAIAQVQPDLAMMDWIAGRVSLSEKPFIQYHAIEALLVAARNADAAYADALKRAYSTASSNYSMIDPDRRTDRADLLREVEVELSNL